MTNRPLDRLLDRLLATAGAEASGTRPPFALLRREGHEHIEVLIGDVETAATLADIPLADTPLAGPEVLALVPYRQVRERGYDCVDDGAPLLCLRVTGTGGVPLAEVLSALPDEAPRVTPLGFDVPDDRYAELVRSVVAEEIGRGEGSNFVIHRRYLAEVAGDPLSAALSTFGRLLRRESGAYWAFLVHTGDRTFVGATPERHVSVDDGLVMMNPISGTYRHTGGIADRAGLLRFLADRKEIDELYMVLDEELKMMASVADLGGQVVGPYLKQMSHLTHTEYLLVGRGSHDVREVLRETMFAPTVVGSPVRNACRVIARRERVGRGYYGGVLALFGADEQGRQTLDAPILIRTVEFGADGRVGVPVGATLVRHSTPEGEVAETYAKARAILVALGVDPASRDREAGPASEADPGTSGVTGTLAVDPEVSRLLVERNRTLAGFWLQAREPAAAPLAPEVAGARVLVVDAEDAFTGMLAHQLRALGFEVTVRPHVELHGQGLPDPGGYDLLVAGPGPGDPAEATDPKMAVLYRLVTSALAERQPLLAICLGHQVLAATLGLPLRRRTSPYQGLQREIEFFGRPERVGYYSTFTGYSSSSTLDTPYGRVTLSRDSGNGDVHALRGPGFAGVQFHAESVLTQHGVRLLRELTAPLLATRARR